MFRNMNYEGMASVNLHRITVTFKVNKSSIDSKPEWPNFGGDYISCFVFS
jgi:hypothetical protein